jgi:putative ABC transport system permease protein
MSGFLQDLRHTMRMLLRAPGFVAVVVLTLAIGIGANTAIFSVVRSVLLRPLPFPESGRIVRIFDHWNQSPRGSVSVPEILDFRVQVDQLQQISAYIYSGGNVTGDGTPERITMGQGTASLFPMLGVQPALGRVFTSEEDQEGHEQVALLTYGFWQRRYGGDSRVLGRTLRIDGRTYTVVGVLPAGFQLGVDVQLWVPLSFDPALRSEKKRGQHSMKVLGRLAPGATMAQAQADLDVVGARLRAAHPKNYPSDSGWNPIAVPMLENMVENVRPSLWMLIGAVGLVLLIACANVANLLLARGTTRHRELSVRAALGAGRGRLVRQLLTESLLLSIVGGGLGLLCALWGVDVLVALGPSDLPRAGEIRVDAGVLAFSLGVTFATGIVFGLLPATLGSRVDLHDALRSGTRTSAGRRPRQLRRALVIAEIALAMVLLAGGGLLVRSFARVVQVDPGFDSVNVLTMLVRQPAPLGQATDADQDRYARFYQQATERLRALPGIEAAGAIDILPMNGDDSDNSFQIVGHERPPGVAPPDEQMRFVTPGYFEALHVPLLRGRTIDSSDQKAAPLAVVINKTFARTYWPGEDPIGRRIRLDWNDETIGTVVGIVGDVHDFGLDHAVKPVMYWAHAQLPLTQRMYVLLRSQLPEATLTQMARAGIAHIDPDQPVSDVEPMTAVVAKSVEGRRFAVILLEVFAALALGLAALGIYGVMAHSVAQRTHEIGVRMALGAQRGNVLGLVAQESARMLIVGLVLGIGGALAVTRFLRSQLYETSPVDPLVICLGVVVLCLASALASYLPARRAARVDPMIALREE